MDTIPSDTQKLMLANVYCGQCRGSTTITNFSSVVKSGDLLLAGKCAACHDDVARVIEMKCKWVNPYCGAPFIGNNQFTEPVTGQYIDGYKEALQP